MRPACGRTTRKHDKRPRHRGDNCPHAVPLCGRGIPCRDSHPLPGLAPEGSSERDSGTVLGAVFAAGPAPQGRGNRSSPMGAGRRAGGRAVAACGLPPCGSRGSRSKSRKLTRAATRGYRHTISRSAGFTFLAHAAPVAQLAPDVSERRALAGGEPEPLAECQSVVLGQDVRKAPCPDEPVSFLNAQPSG